MCEYVTPPASNDFSELPDTDNARFFSCTVSAVFPDSMGSWISTSQPARPGGAPSP